MPLEAKIRVRLLRGADIAFGPGKADLLDAIIRSGSISAAARELGMSYRRAWLLVEAMNRCFASPLVTTAKGGSHGGGAVVTAIGHDVLTRFRAMQAELAAVAERHQHRFAPLAAIDSEEDSPPSPDSVPSRGPQPRSTASKSSRPK